MIKHCAALLFFLSIVGADAQSWHHPLYLGNGELWRQRIPVTIYNEMERDAAGEPVCFAVLRHAPRRQGSLQAYLTVEAAACLPRVADEWPRFLAEMQAYAEGRGRAGLVLPVNADQTALLGSALDAGMRIVQTRVRMVRGGALGGPDDLLMLTLAM